MGKGFNTKRTDQPWARRKRRRKQELARQVERERRARKQPTEVRERRGDR
jgi:hypothetical protein